MEISVFGYSSIQISGIQIVLTGFDYIIGFECSTTALSHTDRQTNKRATTILNLRGGGKKRNVQQLHKSFTT